jgi:nitrogen fixation/metabolism regulation signal transduction histidine kinase
LTEGLTDFADGDWSRRVDVGRRTRQATDEIGRAVDAFNHMAEQMRQNRERLVHLTQVASWQSLARKMAHEVKNSLTPIRLTVEEMQARLRPDDRTFLDQAVQIVVSEIDDLERRVRAFSEFSSEPSVAADVLDVNALVNERVALLRPVYPETTYDLELDASRPRVRAGADLLKGILTNLLKNAAEAAGSGGTVLVATRAGEGHVAIEVHDSGPGLSPEAAATLFEPTITFKAQGMGLGLSIAKRHALVSGGDLAPIDGRLPGAAFRVTLPAVDPAGASST